MVVGVIFSGNIPYYRAMHVAFLNEIQKKLSTENDDIKYVVQFPAADPVALSNAARKLVVGDVDLIVSYGYSATHAVLAKGSDIPLVYCGVYDPNSVIDRVGPVTGCGYKVPLSSLFRYYRQILDIKRLVVVYSKAEADSVEQLNELVRLAGDHKTAVMQLDFSSRGDLEKLNGIGEGDAVFITGSTPAHIMMKDILALLRDKKIPAADIFSDSSEEGVLIALFQEPEQQGRSAAEIVAKIIGGEKADKIEPIVQNSTELIFNLIEAKELGVRIPNELIGEATRTIH